MPLLVDLAAMRSAVERMAKEPAGHRAARPGRAGRRPLGAGRLLVDAGCAPPEHGDRVQEQPRALRVPQVGDAGLSRVRRGPARRGHRPPGQPGAARRGRPVERDGVCFPGHARWNRLAHDHDQRHGHRGLGRGRNRGGGRDAGPAGLPAHARRRRRAHDRAAGRGRDRDGPRSHRHRDAPKGEGRRKVRGVSRRGRGLARGGGPRSGRRTWRRSTERRSGSSRWTRRPAEYLLATGRPEEHVATFRSYYQAQGMFGMPLGGECDYSEVLELDLSSVRPSVSGPRRPQDRIPLPDLGRAFRALLEKPAADGGYGKAPESLGRKYPTRIGVQAVSPETPLSRAAGSQQPASLSSPEGRTRIRSPRSRW